MIPGTSNIIPIVSIIIDTSLIDDNIENGGDAYMSKQKYHNLAVGQ